MQYGLYKNGEPFTSPSGNASSWQIGLHVNGTRNTPWAFFCTYGQLIQGRTVTSHISDPISLAVFPTPAHPSLQLSPHYPMYLTGESVTVECIIPHGPYVAQNHTVLRDGHPLLEPSGPRFTLNVTPSDSGNYSCGYSTELHGRHLHSPHSQLVLLGVTDPPPHPLLSVDPPSGAVSKGHPLNITCAAPRDTGVRRFHFYKDGAEIITGDAGPEISATEPRNSSMNVSVLSIPRANANTTGEFTCGYKENMGGRWVLSPRSEAVNVTVTDWSLLIFQVAVGGGAALALALMLMVCLCRRKKKAGRRLSTSYWKSMELRHSRIMRQSEDISGVNMALQQKTQRGWHHETPRDWGLLPKFPTEGPGSGKAAVGAVPPKCQKGDEDADSGAEFEFPELDPTYSLLTFSSSTFHQGKGLPASPEPIYELPPPPPSPDPCRQ
uniref:Ig-like domain-containing protein n=1 Tax=Pelusios castaneus TaxID=367368 RepID=A0A8C8RZI9_9SAUR